MLKTASYHKLVPKDPLENIRWRSRLLQRCRADPRYRAAVTEMCRRDILFFIDAFVWQFNPNAIAADSWSREVGPFICFPAQRKAVKKIVSCVERRKSLAVVKSREMGASWMFLIVMLWYVLFHKWKKFLCVSKDENAVDKSGEPDCLFWKIDHIIKYLPEWLVPSVTRVKLSIGVPENDSYISGVASTSDAGVGGRATAMLVDEFTLIRDDFKLYAHTANTTKCRIFNGTHRGPDKCLAEITDQDTPLARQIEILELHWSEHPDKRRGLYRWDAEAQKVEFLDPGYDYAPDYEYVTDGTPVGGPHPGLRSPWYDEMCESMGNARVVAMDLDIDVKGSVEQIFDPIMIKHLVAGFTRPPTWEGTVTHSPVAGAKRPLEFDPHRGGLLQTWVPLDEFGRPPPGVYVFAADIAQGLGATPSCVCGYDAVTGRKVLEYVNAAIEPTPFAELIVPLVELWKDYDGNDPLLCWEFPGPGVNFGKRVMELGYRRVYYRPKNKHQFKRDQSQIPGWFSQNDTKAALIIGYKDALKARKVHNTSARALKDTLNFKFKSDGNVEHSGEKSENAYSGARVNHGDLVIADAMCWLLIEYTGHRAGAPREAPAREIRPGCLAHRMRMAEDDGADPDTWGG